MKLFSLLLLTFFASQSFARDVETQQAAVTFARQEMDKAKEEYDSDTLNAAKTKKTLERLSKQLEDEQKKAEKSKIRYQEAKLKFDNAQSELDKAWKKQ